MFLVFAIAEIAWFTLPVQPDLSEKAIHMIIIFVSSMACIMLEAAPPVVCLLMSMTVANITGVIEAKDGFSGFVNVVPWLLFSVLSLAKVITKTSIGIRLAYIFIKYFGHGIIGLSYSIILTEFFMAPILPSNTARGASIGLPLVSSLSKYISSRIKGVSEKSIGAYLSILYSYSNAICSGMFITAMISNSLIVESAANIGVNLTWLSWLKFTIIPCLIILFIIPFILKILCNPKVKKLENIRVEAKQNYKNLGKITEQEKFIILIFVSMLIMWIFADSIGIPIIVTTLIGICIFILFGILDIKEMLSCYSTFNAVIMIGILISYVNNLITFGAIDWFNGVISGALVGFDKDIAFFMLSIIYFFTHYFFSGEGSRIIALYAPFLATGISLGIDKTIVVMTLAVFSSLSDVVAHYTCPSSITMFSMGYVSAKKWATCGIFTAIIIISIWFSYVWLLGK